MSEKIIYSKDNCSVKIALETQSSSTNVPIESFMAIEELEEVYS